MRIRNRFLRLASALLFLVLGAGALAQGSGSGSAEGDAGVSIFPPESTRVIEDLLNELAEPGDQGDQVLEKLLEPANTNSPRDTIISFIKKSQRYYELLIQNEYTREDTAELQHLYDQMQWYFDLRGVAPALRQDVAVNSAVYLREILDRIGLPPLEEIPDRQQMLAVIDEGHPPTWKIGNSPLEIVRINDGPNQGEYLFSEETLASVEELFWQLRSFPYRSTSAEGFYEASFLTPRPTLQAWTDSLPAWMHKGFLDQTVWQWIAMVLLFALALLAIWFLSFVLKRLTRTATPLARDATLLLVPLFAVFASFLLYDLIGDKIFITGVVFQIAVDIIYGMAMLAGIIFIFSLGTVLIDLAVSTKFAKQHPSYVHLATLGIRVVSIVASIAFLLQGMYLMGFSLATIIAGVGVTGLAIALAAQNTLRNVFGSLMLLLDRPFEMGQRIKIQGYDGVVEGIGMRSTRLRLLSGHLVTIPNENVAGMDIENVDMRPSIRRSFDLSLAFNTPLEKIERAVTILREILSVPDNGITETRGQPSAQLKLPGDREVGVSHPNEAINHPDHPPRVFFNDINAGSLNINIAYWYIPPDYPAYLEHCQMINQEIIRRFRDEDIQFSFSST